MADSLVSSRATNNVLTDKTESTIGENVRPTISDFLELCKIKVVALLVLTALVGLALAPDVGRGYFEQILSLLGIGLLAS
ncbi:MAG: protoheme IX farnesyltransferase, partial [Psychromonas sp.]